MRKRAVSLWRGVGRRQFALALALLAVLALAAALRFYGLDGQSLWNDEGTSISLAGRSLAQITRDAAADIHPPFYYYLLHFWLGLFGSSEVGARSLSAILGVGLVGLVYLTGRRLFDERSGLVAALLVAVSSYQVYYAQEARMYVLLALLGTASSYLFYLAWLEPGQARRWPVVGWALVTALALYTHYLAITIVLAQNLAWLVSLAIRARRGRGAEAGLLPAAASWVAAQAVVALLYAPWLRLTWAQLHRWPAVSEPLGLAGLLRQALPLFVLGPFVPAGSLPGLVAAALGVALLGLVWRDGANERTLVARALAFLHWLAPLAVVYYLSRTRPLYHPKFLLAATPGLALLLGRATARLAPGPSEPWERGLSWLRVGLALTAGLALVTASIPGLANYYSDPRYARDDYRGIAHYISALGRPGDVVLINAPSQIETVAYYYRGPLPLRPLPLQRPPDRARTLAELESLARGAQRIFGIFWATDESDPERLVEGWLDGHAYKALDAWYGNVRLVIYAVPSRQDDDEIQHPLNVNLGGQVRLAGYTLAASEVAAGDILQLSLFWEATNVIQRRYKVFTHVIDPAGHLVGQRDAEPGGGTRFTSTWREGEQIVDRYGLPILPGTAPGEYLVEVGMYNPDDGLRLPIVEGGRVAGDRVILQTVRVVRPQAPPPLAGLDMLERRPIRGEEIQLLGFSLARLGEPAQERPLLRAGEAVELVLFWQALRAPQRDELVLVRLVDRAGRVRLEHTTPHVGGRYPPTHWQPEEIVRDPMHLRLPADLPPGRYRLLVGWQGAAPQLYDLTSLVVQ